MPMTSQGAERRKPSQERSRATVDAVLTATAQLLVSDGYARLTARSIAVRAGVSVGSLYQYFPGKAALVRALSQRHREDVIATLRDGIERTAGRSLRERAPLVLRSLIAAKTQNPALSARLTAAMIELDGPCYLAKETDPFVEIVQELLAAEEGPREGHRVQAFVIVRALEGVLSGAAHGEVAFDDPRIEEALTRLVLGVVASEPSGEETEGW